MNADAENDIANRELVAFSPDDIAGFLKTARRFENTIIEAAAIALPIAVILIGLWVLS